MTSSDAPEPRSLRLARRDWTDVEEEETRLLCQMTPQESLLQWLRLQEAFKGQLDETEELFGPERRAAMVELQERLHRFGQWVKAHGEPVSRNPGRTATTRPK